MRLKPEQWGMLASLGIGALLYGLASLFQPDMASFRVLLDLVNGNAALGVVAVGMTLVILSGGVDLSVGSVFALSCTLTAYVTMRLGWPPMVGYLLSVAAGTLIGASSGWVIHAFRLAPFIVTLAGMFVARGLALSVRLESIGIDHPTHQRWVEFAAPMAGGKLHLNAIIFVAVLVLAVYVLRWRPLGRSLYAIGGQELSARFMGVSIGRVKVAVYATSGACSALAGVMRTFEMSSGDPTAGVGLELEAIAAAVIGGTRLTGGVGGVGGTLAGVLILGTIQTWIMFDGRLSSWWAKVATGGLLLGFVLLQRVIVRGTAMMAGSNRA